MKGWLYSNLLFPAKVACISMQRKAAKNLRVLSHSDMTAFHVISIMPCQNEKGRRGWWGEGGGEVCLLLHGYTVCVCVCAAQHDCPLVINPSRRRTTGVLTLACVYSTHNASSVSWCTSAFHKKINKYLIRCQVVRT